MEQGRIVSGTGAEREVEPDQVIAAAELSRLRAACAAGGEPDVAELRRTATALRDRAMADDSGDAYAVHREGVVVRVTRRGARQDSLRNLGQHLAVKYPQRSLGGWIAGLVIGLLCLPVGRPVGEAMTDAEAEAYNAIAVPIAVLAFATVAVCLIWLITVARRNRENRRALLGEHEHLQAELQFATTYLAERHERVLRARAEAEAAGTDLVAILDRAMLRRGADGR